MNGTASTLSKASLCASFLLVQFVLLTFVSTQIVFLCWGRVTAWPCALSFVAMTATGVYLLPKVLCSARRTCVTVAIVWSLVGFSFAAATAVYDLSYDGQSYQMEAIGRIVREWNPLREKLPGDGPYVIFINHYPKATWFTGAAFAALTGHLESGKAINLLFLFAAFGCFVRMFEVVVEKSPWWRSMSLFLATLTALNPVAVIQVFTHYVDGTAASLLGILAASSVLFCMIQSRLVAGLALMSLVVVVNVKFTALGYLVVIVVAVAVAVALMRKWQLFRRIVIASGTSLVAGVLVLGWNPYVRNITSHRNIFYPLLGKGSVDIMSANTPPNLQGKTWSRKVATALLARSYTKVAPVELKCPLTVSRDEMANFVYPDVRVGGLGPFFGGAVLLAGVGAFGMGMRY